MKLTELNRGIDKFDVADSAFATAAHDKLIGAIDKINQLADSYVVEVAQKTDALKADVTHVLTELKEFLTDGMALQAEAVTEVKALFAEFSAQAELVDAETRRLAREARAFADAEDPPPAKPEAMDVTITDQN